MTKKNILKHEGRKCYVGTVYGGPGGDEFTIEDQGPKWMISYFTYCPVCGKKLR